MKTSVDEKDVAYKKWIDRPTTTQRLGKKRLQKTACKICKKKKK
jgi:hypothetical protein